MIMCTKRRIFLVLAILTTAFIFSNSMQAAELSSLQSGRIVRLVQNILEAVGFSPDTDTLTTIIRKCAHFAEFFLQGFWLGLFFLAGKKPFLARIIHILFAGLLTACTDEFIQTFFDGRAGLLSDVFIDFAGVLLAALLCLVFDQYKKKRG